MHPRLSVDQLCFPEATLAEFVGECRELRVDHVVLPAPASSPMAASTPRAHRSRPTGPRPVAINHPFAVTPDLEHDDGTVATFVNLLGIAAEFDVPTVYVLTGGRGRLSWEAAADRFSTLMAQTFPVAEQHGISVLLENANPLYADIHIAHSLVDALELAVRSGLGLCLDFQFCWAEGGLDALLRRAVPWCGLVQVSDYVLGDRSLPGRAVPGDEVIPLGQIVGFLLSAGYEGVFDIELLGPRIQEEVPRTAVRRTADHVGAILDRLGA